jgi:toxin CptA
LVTRLTDIALERYGRMIRACLRPSRRIGAALAVCHVAAAAAAISLDVPLSIRTALALAVAASVVHSVCLHALLKTNRSVLAIEVKDRHTAAVQGRDGAWRDARILGTSYVTAALTVLNLRIAGERLLRHVVIVPDNIDEREFRRIRVLLRWSRASSHDTRAANVSSE